MLMRRKLYSIQERNPFINSKKEKDPFVGAFWVCLNHFGNDNGSFNIGNIHCTEFLCSFIIWLFTKLLFILFGYLHTTKISLL